MVVASRRVAGAAVAAAVAIAGCGGSAIHFASTRPAPTINLSVYIDNARVALSPRSVGAGLVTFNITNQTSQRESLTIARLRVAARPFSTTGPIAPNGTAQVTVRFPSGVFTVSTVATTAIPTAGTIAAALLQVGPPRGGGNDSLLLP